MSLERLAEAGLYDRDSPNAAERREYLEYLLERFTVDDILSVNLWRGPVTDILAVLNGERHEQLTAAEVAERTGLPVAEIEEIRATLGLPVTPDDEGAIAATFVEDATLYQFAVAMYGRERTLAFMRVLGAGLAALTEAGRELTWAPTRDVAMTELEVALTNDASMAAWRALGPLISHLMLEFSARDIDFEEELRRGPLARAVAFVDLVGSTDWTTRLAAEDHAAALNRFEALALRSASRHGCRVVKFIGDAAMVVGPSPAGVAEAAVELCAELGGDEVLPGARGAVGYGRVTARAGDYFGDVVNVVARATKAAPSGGVVATVNAAAHLDSDRWVVGSPRTVSARGLPEGVELVEVTLK